MVREHPPNFRIDDVGSSSGCDSEDPGPQRQYASRSMSTRTWSAFVAVASLLTVCATLASRANDASASQFLPKLDQSARYKVIEVQYRGRGAQAYLPIAPSYLAYDYPYYYSRGHYPTGIGGPGYVYYGFPYSYGSSPRFGSECAYWPSKSVRRAWINAQRCVGR